MSIINATGFRQVPLPACEANKTAIGRCSDTDGRLIKNTFWP